MRKRGYLWIATMAVAPLLAIASYLVAGAQPTFTEKDKAYYADANTVNFVRPGMVLKILSGEIAADGTIRVKFRLTDPKGLPLDKDGVTTPGPVALQFVAGYIAKGQTQYTSYTTRVFTNNVNPKPTTDPWTDANGTYQQTGDGEYTYTFATKAPAGFDTSVTHSIGGQASRDLSEFDMGRFADNDVYSWVPNGSAVTVVRDVVRTATCNARCHDPLAVHGGNRRKVELCIMCHQQDNRDAYKPENSLSFPVLIHKIHRGSSLPSVTAGGKNVLNNTDFSDVVFPANVINCEVCHDQKSGARQADAYFQNPNRAACGACHDDVNFATGDNHVNLPQMSDDLCGNCHIPQGELEFDASIKGAHTEGRFSRDLPGVNFDIVSIADGAPGKKPTVTFSIKDNKGNPIPPSKMDRVSLTMAGPTTDYPGMVTDSATAAQGPDGAYRWTMSAAIPADARGSFSVGIEGYKNITLLPGTKKEQTVRNTGMNKVKYFSVDGSPVKPRRKVVAIENCNACHLKLEMHGGVRNDVEHCVQCHNPNQTDAAQRPQSRMPAQVITFKTMVHRIHTGENLKIEYTVYGYNSSIHDFTDVVFPGDRRNCAKCHVNKSEQLPLPSGEMSVVNPRGQVNPMGPIAAACMGCHTGDGVPAHVMAMTTPIGESCDVCHGSSAEFSVSRVHAR